MKENALITKEPSTIQMVYHTFFMTNLIRMANRMNSIDELEKLILRSQRTLHSAKEVLATLEQEQYELQKKISELRLLT